MKEELKSTWTFFLGENFSVTRAVALFPATEPSITHTISKIREITVFFF